MKIGVLYGIQGTNIRLEPILEQQLADAIPYHNEMM